MNIEQIKEKLKANEYDFLREEIGRASCREIVFCWV